MAEKRKSIPMDQLVNCDKNMYELTNAAIHRAEQISITGNHNSDESEGKVVSNAIGEIVTEEVKYEYKKS